MDEHSELLEKHFSLKEINAGEYWAVEGQYTKSIGYVESGLLHAYQIDNQGEMVTTNFFLHLAHFAVLFIVFTINSRHWSTSKPSPQ